MTRDRIAPSVIVVAIILVCTLSISMHVADAKAVPAATGITLSVDFDNGTILNYSSLTGSTVLNLTNSVVDVEVQWTGGLAFVTAINGIKQDQHHWWQYWVNGEYGTVAANLYELNDGDSIEWKRTSSAYSTARVNALDYSLITGSIIISASAVGFLLVLYKWTAKKERG